LHGSLFLNTDLKALVEFHQSRNALATLGVRRTTNGSRDWHHLELRIGEGDRVEGITVRNLSNREQHATVPAGVYVFDPAVLPLIEPGIYYDIKEQLLPQLRRDGKPVFACEIRGYCRNVLEMNDYLKVNRSVLRGEVNGYRFEGQIAEGIWVGRGSEVSPTATLHGPVMIGRDCVIGPGVQIIGREIRAQPASLAVLPDAQARIRSGGGAYGPRRVVALAYGGGPGHQAQQSGPRLFPAAAVRSPRAGFQHGQIPDDGEGRRDDAGPAPSPQRSGRAGLQDRERPSFHGPRAAPAQVQH